MREIKFRAWDKRLTLMSTVSVIEWHKMNPETPIYIRGRIINKIAPYLLKQGLYQEWQTGGETETSKAVKLEDVTLMQFTGLKDKKGVEIYEGDIVIYNTRANGYKPEYSQEPQTIVWNEKLARFEFKDFWYSAGLIYNNFEIIGNIYESPELLDPPLGNGAEPIRNISEDDLRKDDL